MPKLNIDISGRRGLVERHQGDLNDTAAQPHLRYIGEAGQFADGIFNPFKYYGYMAPANNSYVPLTGTIGANIISIQYDAKNDVVYLAEEGENMLQLNGLDDTSIANAFSVASGTTIKDMIIYEMNGELAQLFIIDSGSEVINNSSTQAPEFKNENGCYVGFRMLDGSKGINEFNAEITGDHSLFNSIIDDGTNHAVRLAQSFTTQSNLSGVYAHAVSGVSLKLRRDGTAAATFKVSIQASTDRNSGDFTFRGDWAASTGYSVNDVVESPNNNDINYVCHTAHTSSAAGGAGNEPGVGADWNDYWEKFGAPDGTDIVSTTFNYLDVPDNSGLTGVFEGTSADWNGIKRMDFNFGAIAQLDAGTVYWIVIEEVGSNMTSADELGWLSNVNGNYNLYNSVIDSTTSTFLNDDTFPAIGKYAQSGASPAWRHITTQIPTSGFDFKLILNRDDNWSATSATGAFGANTGLNTFLYLAENALVYWIVGNKVHSLDGGITGGVRGRAIEEVLTFPSYLQIVDAAETRSRMYIGLHDAITSDDDRYHSARECGVFLWDRRSQVFGSTDFYRCPGAKEIKKVFKSSDGTIKVITVSNTGFGEIRAISGNQFGVIHTFEKEGYPVGRRSVTQLAGMTKWTGKNGIKYAYGAIVPGEKDQLYKIGDESGEYGSNPVQGAAFVGNKDASSPKLAVLSAWKDDSGNKVHKWYPNGEGVINSVDMRANQGDVYTAVQEFAEPTHVRWAHLYFIPNAAATSGDTAVATIKWYLNKSSTPAGIRTIKRKELEKGFYYIPIGKKNVWALQFEIENDTAVNLGQYDLIPNRITVDYNDKVTKKK